MNEEKTIKAVNWLLLIASACLFYGLTYLVTDEHREKEKDTGALKLEVPKIPQPKKETPENLIAVYEFRETFANIPISYTTIETEYLGMYFVTAYCPEECGGSWQTSSGATCHYSEEWHEPTTCAIDRNVHGFGEIILIGNPETTEKKLYITEDTGPGVRGLWVDCFVETMSEVEQWPTGWRPVYAVHYETHEVSARKARLIHESFANYLFSGCAGAGLNLRHDPRAND